ncbi:MAG TPA: hypothetical protein PLG59_19430 [bacterium]|nr:hypothetical protein [bacterium]HQO36844.1 hypothetical protein [bacterium]HQP98295.1 hypothetical protein [bacterium]
MRYFAIFVVAVVLLVGLATQPFAQVVEDPVAAGITPITGDIPLLRGYGGSHHFAAAWLAILGDGRPLVVMPNPTLEEQLYHVAILNVLDRQGNVLEERAGYQDDNGVPIMAYLGGDPRGVAVDARGNQYAVVMRAQPYAPVYTGDGVISAFAGADTSVDSGVPIIQVFNADGTKASNIVNIMGKGSLFSDSGQIRGRACAIMSNGNIALNWWDQKSPTGGLTGDRWPGYEGTGQVVGIAVISPDGSIVVPPTPISTPTVGGNASTMRGVAAGNGWFCCRFQDSDTVVKYSIFNNVGAKVRDIIPANLIDAAMDGGMGATIAGGRGDSELIYGQGDFLYTIGRANGATFVMKFDAMAGTLVKITEASPAGDTGERMDICADANGNVFAMWGDVSGGGLVAIGRLFDANLDPVTPEFSVFEHQVLSGGADTWKDVSCRMDTGIIVASCHTTGLPDNEATPGLGNLPLEHCVRIFANPLGPSAVQNNWELY